MTASWAAVTDREATEAVYDAATGYQQLTGAATVDEFRAAVFAASVKVNTATGAPASTVLLSTDAFIKYGSALLPANYGTMNQSGTAAASTLEVTVSGLRVAHAPHLPAATGIVTNGRAAAWAEDGPFVISAPDVPKLGEDVAIWGMAALEAFVPAGIVVLAATAPTTATAGRRAAQVTARARPGLLRPRRPRADRRRGRRPGTGHPGDRHRFTYRGPLLRVRHRDRLAPPASSPGTGGPVSVGGGGSNGDDRRRSVAPPHHPRRLLPGGRLCGPARPGSHVVGGRPVGFVTAASLAGGVKTLGDVVTLAAARLPVIFGPLSGWSVWDQGPPDATGLPAVWLELATGGGIDYDNPTLTPATLRIVAAVTPQAAPLEHATFATVIDALDAGYRQPLASDVATRSRTWTIDTVEVGGVDRDAVLYDLALAYANC